MKKLLFFLFTLANLALYAQILDVSYPNNIDTFPNQTINIPIICENLTNQSITVFPDYFSTFYDYENEYKINKILPRPISPGRKELIFISLHPNINLQGGRRYFPFALKDEAGSVITTGFFEIQHIVHESMEIVPLSDYRYIIPDIDDSVSFLLRNRGTVPVEFKTTDYKISKIIQPGVVDTLVVRLSELQTIERNDFWVNFKIDYLITTIFPNELKEEKQTLHRFIPVALKSAYPKKHEYYNFPVNISQYAYFDKSKYGDYGFTSQQYRTSLYGSGYLDDFPSPYLSWRVDYNYDIIEKHKDDDYFRYNALFRSNVFSFEVGESSYQLDLKNTPKYGEGYNASLYLSRLLLEGTVLKELYRDEPIHSAFALGYVWEKDTYLYEPQQFVRYRYYQKQSSIDSEKEWYHIENTESIEHIKHILDTQFKLLNAITFHLETFIAYEDSLSLDQLKNPGVTAELFVNTQKLYNRFAMIFDKQNIYNETAFRYKYQNDLNFNSDELDIYTSVQYSDEKTTPRPELSANHYYKATFAFANLYLKTYKDLYARGKIYDNRVEVFEPRKTETYLNESLFGLMLKNSNYELEGLFGYKLTENTIDPNRFTQRDAILDANFVARKWGDSSYHIIINNRFTFMKDETTIQSYFTFYNGWSRSVSQNTGIYNFYNSRNSWRDYFSVFSYLNVRFPWQHDLRFGGSYNVNPSYTENYRFSVMAEYSIPFDLNLIRKSNSKYLTVSVFDPWQKKPVENAVFDIGNHYYVSNDVGLIRPRKAQIGSYPIRIINLPDGFTTNPPLSELTQTKASKVNLQIIKYSQLSVGVKKRAYLRVTPQEAEQIENLAYYRNSLVDLDNTILETCSEPVELILQKVGSIYDTHRAIVDAHGYAVFNKLPAGRYILMLNNNIINDLLFTETGININIEPSTDKEVEMIIDEKASKFIRYE